LPSSDSSPNLTPVELAGWLLATRRLAVANGLTWPSVDEIFAATNASRHDAYAIADAIIAASPVLEEALREPAVAHGVRIHALVHEALGFVMRHPGCAQSSPPARYTARYRRFVLALRKRYADLRRPTGVRVCRRARVAARHARGLDGRRVWRGGCGFSAKPRRATRNDAQRGAAVARDHLCRAPIEPRRSRRSRSLAPCWRCATTPCSAAS